MAIPTQQSLTGFISTDPELTFTADGVARFYARAGHEHFQANDDGTFTKLPNTYHDLVQFRRAAERSFEQLKKGDHFVAEGRVHVREFSQNGEPRVHEEFIAKKIGHDLARTNYVVKRRNDAPVAVESNSAELAVGTRGRGVVSSRKSEAAVDVAL